MRATEPLRSYNRSMRWLKYLAAAVTVAPIVIVLRLLSVSYAGIAAPLLLLDVVVVARLWGTGPALVAAASGAGAYSYYFLPPAGFGIEDAEDWIAFVTFIVTAVIAGELASRAERRAAEAQAGRTGDRAAVSGAAERVRARQRSRGGAAQRAAEGGAARRAHAQPADAADLDQGGGDGADPQRRLEPGLGAVGRRAPRAAAGDRRGVRSPEPLHRGSVDARSDAEPVQPIHLRAIEVDELLRSGPEPRRDRDARSSRRRLDRRGDSRPCRWTRRRSPK